MKENPDNIKPCPFCGMPWEEDELAIEWEGFFEHCFRVVCSGGHIGAWKSTKEEAIKDWNTRKEPK